MRWWFLAVAAGCAGVGPKSDSGSGGDACALAEASQTCPECSDGPWACAYGGAQVVRGSCGDCQVRHELYQALCDAGETASAADLEAGTRCAAAPCAWVLPACGCTPECANDPDFGAAGAAPSSSSATQCSPCPTPDEPVGECSWDGARCVVTGSTL